MADDTILDDDDFLLDEDSGEALVELSESEEKLARRRRYTSLRRRVEDKLEERKLRNDYCVYSLEDLAFD